MINKKKEGLLLGVRAVKLRFTEGLGIINR